LREVRDAARVHLHGQVDHLAELEALSAAFAPGCRGRVQEGHARRADDANILQYPVCLFGAQRAGCTVVNVNPLYTARELQHQLNDSGAEVLVVVENFAKTVSEVVGTTRCGRWW